MDQTTEHPAVERPFRTLWIGAVLLVLILAVAAVLSRPRQPPLPILGRVENFSLTNQLGQAVTLDTLRGQVWLADVIFTRCPGPCARMTRQMVELQAALPSGSRARLISLTTDPEFDTPEVLQKYANHYQAAAARWQFLTGTKSEIANLGINSLKLAAVEKLPEQRTQADDLFIHATIFVLVDKQARLRGIYETGGEGVEWPRVRATILAALNQLEREP